LSTPAPLSSTDGRLRELRRHSFAHIADGDTISTMDNGRSEESQFQSN
jgi:hypothetical protein